MKVDFENDEDGKQNIFPVKKIKIPYEKRVN